ncbi:helix-turn-helix transcriptional regulator [Rubneribacter sp.]
MRSIQHDMYEEAFRLWDMAPAGMVPGYGPAGSVRRFENELGSGEYWAYFHGNLFAVNAFDMRFKRTGAMRYRHAEHLSIAYYEKADLVVQNGNTPRAGTVSTYLAEEGAEYVAFYQPGSAVRATSLTISPDYYRDYLHSRFGDIPNVRRAFALVDDRADLPELVSLLRQVRSYQGTGMAAALFYEGAVSEALALIIERAKAIEAERAEGGRTELSQEDRAALDNVSAYINGNLAGALTCEELARRACMGQTKLKAAFKTAYGTSPAAFVTNARIERAIELLSSTDLPIAQVAHAVGYRKPGAFAEAFRRRTGVAPSAYR